MTRDTSHLVAFYSQQDRVRILKKLNATPEDWQDEKEANSTDLQPTSPGKLASFIVDAQGIAHPFTAIFSADTNPHSIHSYLTAYPDAKPVNAEFHNGVLHVTPFRNRLQNIPTTGLTTRYSGLQEKAQLYLRQLQELTSKKPPSHAAQNLVRPYAFDGHGGPAHILDL